MSKVLEEGRHQDYGISLMLSSRTAKLIKPGDNQGCLLKGYAILYV